MTTVDLKAVIHDLLKTLLNATMWHADIDPCFLSEETVERDFGGDWKVARRKWRVESADVNKQCLERFGKGWGQLRRDLGRSLMDFCNSGYNYGLANLTQQVARNGGTGNWMTNKYLRILYLYSIHTTPLTGPFHNPYPTAEQQEEMTKRALQQQKVLLGYEKTADQLSDENIWTLLYLAPFIAPDEVRAVIHSHRRYLPKLTKDQKKMQKALREHAVTAFKTE